MGIILYRVPKYWHSLQQQQQKVYKNYAATPPFSRTP